MSSSQLELDRSAISAITMLFVIAVLVNTNRFVSGPSGPLLAHDVADYLVTSLGACGDFWHSSLRSAWDSSQLRGWPRPGSAIHPGLLMCVVAGVSPSWMLLPILHTLLTTVMAVGTFLFVYLFLRRTRDVAVAGSVLHLSLFFYYHEHPSVISLTLLPALLGFLSLASSTWSGRLLGFVGAALVICLGNPPAVLFVMPLAHLCLIVAAPRSRWRGHIIRWFTFWCAYGLYYLPTLVAQFRELGNSSRSLYRAGSGVVEFWPAFKEMLVNPAVIIPAGVLIALVSRRTWRPTVLAALAVVGGVALFAGNQVLLASEFGRRFPILVSASTLYYRLYYFVPIVALLWATSLWQAQEEPTTRTPLCCRALGISVYCLLAAYPFYSPSQLYAPYWKYAAVIGVSTGLGLAWWTRRLWTILIVAGGVILFCRYQYSQVYEVSGEGNLFVEEPHLGQPQDLSRTVTVMNTCDGTDIFAAQAQAAGQQTLDGASNYYDRAFAERWRYFVANNPALCTARFSGWETRAELTVGDLEAAPDRILPWLWINNVHYVRSPKALDYPELELVDRRPFVFNNVGTLERFLYRFRQPVSRVFSLPIVVAAQAASGDLGAEERALNEISTHGGVMNIDAQSPDSSHVSFSANPGLGRLVTASINYHPGWRLRVDGSASPLRIERGPFGMIAFRPIEGLHRYDLEFHSSFTWLVPVFMVVALGFLWVSTGRRFQSLTESALARSGHEKATADVLRRRFLRWSASGVGLATLGWIGWTWFRRGEKQNSIWFAPDWRHRLGLTTIGAFQTTPIQDFPLRVELGPAENHFWENAVLAGADIRFADTRGRQLPFEIEEFDSTTRRLIAWVRLSELSVGPQTTYLYYGNPQSSPAATAASVWDHNYEAVWHLNPHALDPSGALKDSSGHAHAGTPRGIPVGPASDQAGLAFDGRGGFVEVPAWPGVGTPAGDWTIEFALRHAPSNGRNFGILQYGKADAFHLYLHNLGVLVLERRTEASYSEIAFSRDPIPADVWTAITLTRTRRHLSLSVNGVLRSTYPSPDGFRDAVIDGPLFIGTGSHGALVGELAELRVSKGVARSADWIYANFKSQTPSFITKTPAESR